MTHSRFVAWQGSFPKLGGRGDLFKVTLDRALDELLDECEKLGADEVLIETGFPPSELTRAGRPPARGTPVHPAIRIAFTSVEGPLTFECGQYDRWTANLRAIGLTLVALRAVDRYGAATGKQYTGYKAIDSGPDPVGVLREYGGSSQDLKATYRAAMLATHPDQNDGDRSKYDLVEAAATKLRSRGML